MKIFSFLLIYCFASCKSVSFQENLINLNTDPGLGTIGVFQDKLMSNDFNVVGLPELDEKIKLSIKKIYFNNSSLRKYNKKIHEEELKLELVDSLKYDPYYFKIEISNKIGLIEILNNSANKEIRDYLEISGKNLIVTSVFIYFTPEISVLVENALAIYLINNKKSSYSMELLYKDGSGEILNFKEGTAFNYGLSGFCWKANYKREAIIAALRERTDPCPGDSKIDPEKVYSKDIFEKLN